MKPRLFIALLLPFLACGLQWLLWEGYIKPYVWFLFFPAAFFSAWLGGLKGGLASGVIGALLVWCVFIPPPFSFALENVAASASIVLFVIMGGLFGWVFERLEQAQWRTAEALDATESANEKITRLYEKTLELDELKSQFFANVSHELRTPLTLIMAPLERQLCRPASADFSAADRKEAEMMLRNARLLYRHVSDLLDAAKLEAGGMQADYARVEYAELVRAVSSNFDSVANDHGEDMAMLRTCLSAGDREQARRIAHTLKGTAGILGATLVQERATALDAALKDGTDPARIEADITAVDDALKPLVAALLASMNEATAPAPATIDWAALRQLFDELEPLLAAGNTESNGLMEAHVGILKTAFGQRATELDKCIDHFLYPEALDILRQLRQAYPELGAS